LVLYKRNFIKPIEKRKGKKKGNEKRRKKNEKNESLKNTFKYRIIFYRLAGTFQFL
jgi:hypothetical protein